MIKLKEEIYNHWTDEHGQVLLDYEGQVQAHTDNGIFFLTCFMFLCKYLNIIDDKDKTNYNLAVAKCQRQLNNSPVKGLFNRLPGLDTVTEAHDNYVAICAGSVLFDLTYHFDIYEYGEDHGYCYDNVRPYHWNLSQCRQGSDVAFIKLIVGKSPAIWEYIWFIFSILSTTILARNTTSPKLVTWLRLEALAHKSLFWKGIKNLWFKLISIRNKGGMAEIFEIYFKERILGHPHPFVAMAKEAFK